MLKNRRSLTIRQQSLHKLNQQILLLLKGRIFLNSHPLIQLLLREIWMLKSQWRNQRLHSKQISNLLLIKDILKNKPSSLLNKKLRQISKLVNKLKLKLKQRQLTQFHQKKESQLQLRKLPPQSQRLRLSSRRNLHQLRLLLLQLLHKKSQSLQQRLLILFRFKIRYSKLKNNRQRLKLLLKRKSRTKESQQLPQLK